MLPQGWKYKSFCPHNPEAHPHLQPTLGRGHSCWSKALTNKTKSPVLMCDSRHCYKEHDTNDTELIKCKRHLLPMLNYACRHGNGLEDAVWFSSHEMIWVKSPEVCSELWPCWLCFASGGWSSPSSGAPATRCYQLDLPTQKAPATSLYLLFIHSPHSFISPVRYPKTW